MTRQDTKDLETASNYMDEAEKLMGEAVSAEWTLDDWTEDKRKIRVKEWLEASENFLTEAADLIRKVNRLQ